MLNYKKPEEITWTEEDSGDEVICKPATGYAEDLYVSRDGLVLVNLKTERRLGNDSRTAGYVTNGDGKGKLYYRHRLVAYAWHGLPEGEQTQVHHIDGNRENNDASNLKWVTQEENLAAREVVGTTGAWEDLRQRMDRIEKKLDLLIDIMNGG